MKNHDAMKSLSRLLLPGKVLVETDVIAHLAKVAGTTPEAIERVLSSSEPLINGNFGAPLIRS
ncbi:MAG: hypothetical protein IPG59_13790 [Candidatus Melainabacteria bacterium]|nr:MAG: hypothetical protein IPG59_13790 [Candidatus Melainabacteria bacterium]